MSIYLVARRLACWDIRRNAKQVSMPAMDNTDPTPDRMFAMVLEEPRNPLRRRWLPKPERIGTKC